LFNPSSSGFHGVEFGAKTGPVARLQLADRLVVVVERGLGGIAGERRGRWR